MGVLGVCEICVSSNKIPVETIKFLSIVIGGVVVILTAIATNRHFKRAKKERNKIKNGAERISQFRHKARTRSNVDSKSESRALLDLQQDRSNWFNRGRTKLKILLSFYQIVGQFENVLNVRFPPVFEEFTRRISVFANFDALKLINVNCMVPTSFYTKLIVSTLLPILLAILIGLWWFISHNLGRKNKVQKNEQKDKAVTFFLTLTYIVFASVSTTVFATFNCVQFGDDKNFYLASDLSLVCYTEQHELAQLYATFMILVYPVGIPTLYFVALWRERAELVKTNHRYQNPKLRKLNFLWDNYEPEMWWFEVFECFRRLMLTGVLVFVGQGTSSQIVFAILVSFSTLMAYVHWKPFEEESDDLLSIVTQISIFFTLFAALLRKVQVD